MIVIVSTYLAKAGEEDAIIALHEDWQRNHAPTVKNYISWELLRKIEAPREFIAIAHYENEDFAKAAENNLKHDAWFCRLMSLIEKGPMHTCCSREWRLQ